MTRRSSRLLAWFLFLFFILEFAVTGVFSVLNRKPIVQADDTQALAFLGIAAVGLLLALRQPRNPIGWIFSAVGAWIGAVALSEEYITYTLVRHPGALAGGTFVAWFYLWGWFPLLVSLLTLPFLLFPTGRLPSPRWKPVLRAAIVYASIGWIPIALTPGPVAPRTPNPFGIDGQKGILDAVSNITFLLLPILAVAAVISLFLRFRRAASIERQQIKWFLFAGAVIAAGAVTGIILGQLGIRTPDFFFGLFLVLIPLSTGVAVLKYHLYDIDVVINKTVVYGALAGFITLVYVGIVVGIGAAIGQGDRPNLGLSILATAVVAVAFQPVRERVQRFANRLVYGKRATPYEVLSDFSKRMVGTFGTDDLLPQMARILREGAGAANAAVWLAVGDELRPEARSPTTNGQRLPPIRVGDTDVSALPGSDLSVPVRDRGQLLGALSIQKARGQPLTPTERKLLSDLASQAGLVLRNVKLIEELRASRQRIVSAQDEERRRLERNIHDGAQQQLVALNVKLGLAKALVRKDQNKTGDLLIQLQEETQDALDTLRDLARGIYPPLLRDQGLVAALQAQARKVSIPVRVEAERVGRYPQDLEAAVYFCVLEALQNVAKYAEASRTIVRLSAQDHSMRFEVSDDGVGFDPTSGSYGTGVQGMTDRLEAVGGTLDIRSSRGAGTTVTGELPVRELEPIG